MKAKRHLLILCLSLLLCCVAGETQENVGNGNNDQTSIIEPEAIPPETGKAPRTSYGEQMSAFLREAIRRAFARLPETQRAGNDPQTKSYHWVVMLQVAEPLTQGDERNLDRKNGVALFLESLAEERRSQRGIIADTITIVPYHFNIFPLGGQESAYGKPLADYLNHVGDLTKQIPGTAQPDQYPNGVKYRDGHSWRQAMIQMIKQLEARNMDQSCVVIVLDWNDAEAVPQKPVSGPLKPGSRSYLIDRSLNPKGWQDFQASMDRIGFSERSLAYKRIGGRDYYIEVFTPTHLQPLTAAMPIETPTEVGKAASVASPTSIPPPPHPSRSSEYWWFALLLVPIGVFVFFLINRPVGIQVEGSPYQLRALTNKGLDIFGPDSSDDGQGHRLRKDRAPNAGPYLLATIKLSPGGKISVLSRDSKVVGLQNYDDRADGMGVDMSDSPCEVRLCDSSNSNAVASFEIEKIS